jgi:mannitol-1-phosphate 5-dehydrogenase
MQKLLLFGAGKIGRSFIAQLFSRGGYEIIFVDINKKIVDLLNSIKEYNVVVKGETEYTIPVKNYRAIHFSEKEKIMAEFSETPLVATSVGQNALPDLFPLFAEALVYRYKKTPFSPIDIIIAENLRHADELFKNSLKSYLPEDYPFEKLIGLVETSIGKMVPIMSQKDLEDNPLQIYAEEYNSLPLAANGFKNHLPEISGLKYITNIKAWVDRKSLIHNLGHAAAVYFGFQEMPTEKFLWRLLQNKPVFEKTRATMMQSANILLHKYPYNFTTIELKDHVDDLLARFQNKALGDSVFRVGCDLYRKLNKDDRLSGAIKLANILGQPFNLILEALVCGFYFRATDENEQLLPKDQLFVNELQRIGFEKMFSDITGFTKVYHNEIVKSAFALNRNLSIKN